MRTYFQSLSRLLKRNGPTIGSAKWPLGVLFAFVVAIVAVRAVTQSITIDEADTYVYWVSGIHQPWTPHSNNHLLNTYLIWLFTHVLGLNNVSMRLPSFIGAVLYLSATYKFCVRFADRLALRLPLYACFVLNPFVLDFLVAARGYGLATGFLITAVVILCTLLANEQPYQQGTSKLLAIASLCMGCSFAANFSFAFVIAVSTVLFLTAWFVASPRASRPAFYQAAILTIAPGAVLAAALCGWTLIHWPKGQLVAGATSIQEMWTTFLTLVFSDLSPRFVGHYVARRLRHWQRALPWVLIGVCGAQILTVLMERRRWRESVSASRAALVGLFVGAVVLVTLLVHWAAFCWAGLLLPKDRTSLFFLPLCLMVVGIAANFPFTTIFGKSMRYATMAVLTIGSIFFVGCLRFDYFLLWRFDADMQQTYEHLVELVGRGHSVEVPSHYPFTSSLNFYRYYFHDGSFGPFWLYDNPQDALATHFKPYPLDQPVYVLELPYDSGFIAKQHLKIVYRGPVSNVVIAVRK